MGSIEKNLGRNWKKKPELKLELDRGTKDYLRIYRFIEMFKREIKEDILAYG